MTHTNPSAATPGPDHLSPGETVKSSSPAVTLGPAKAIVAAILGAILTAGAVILQAVSNDGAIDVNEGIAIVLAIAAGAGVPGLGTYIAPTTVKAN